MRRKRGSAQITKKMLKGLMYQFYDAEPLNNELEREAGKAEVQHRLPNMPKSVLHDMAVHVTRCMKKPYNWLLNVDCICEDENGEYIAREIIIEDFCPIQEIFDRARLVIKDIYAEADAGIISGGGDPLDMSEYKHWRIRAEIIGVGSKVKKERKK